MEEGTDAASKAKEAEALYLGQRLKEEFSKETQVKTPNTAEEPSQSSSSSERYNCFLIHASPQSSSVRPLNDVAAQISPLQLQNYGN